MIPDELQKFSESIKAESDKRFRDARDPRIVTAGNINVQGNAGGRLVGGANVTVAGDAKHGYAICSTCPGEDQGTGITLPPTPLPSTTCPCVTFSGVEFCCYDGDSLRPGDFPGYEFNDRLIRHTLQTVGCNFCTQPPADCDENYEVAILPCEGGDPISSVPFNTYVKLISGLWHILAEVPSGFLFYGTTTDLGVPADNQLIACGTVTLDNALITCVFGTPQTRDIAGFNGTATLSECPPCP